MHLARSTSSTAEDAARELPELFVRAIRRLREVTSSDRPAHASIAAVNGLPIFDPVPLSVRTAGLTAAAGGDER
jgi:hypothetical protein